MSSGPSSGSAVWSLPRGVIVLLGLAGTVVTIAGIKAFSSILAPAFLALMLTVAVQPLPNWLRRKGMPAWLAVTVALLCVYGILASLLLSVVVSVARLATLLPQYTDKMNNLVGDLESTLQGQGIGTDQARDLLSHVDAQTVFNQFANILQSAAGTFSDLFFLFSIVLFMAIDAATFTDRLRVLRRLRPDIATAFSSFARGTRRYLVVSTVFGLIVAVFDTGALWALGIPLPVLWGLVAFITNYIPNIGFVVGLIPPALLALLEGGPSLMLWVIVIYSTINVIIQSVIQPKFVGDAVGLSVTLTFLSLVFWTWVIGPLGAVLAIPLSLMTKALLVDIDPATRWADVLLSSKPSSDDEPIPRPTMVGGENEASSEPDRAQGSDPTAEPGAAEKRA